MGTNYDTRDRLGRPGMQRRKNEVSRFRRPSAPFRSSRGHAFRRRESRPDPDAARRATRLQTSAYRRRPHVASQTIVYRDANFDRVFSQ